MINMACIKKEVNAKNFEATAAAPYESSIVHRSLLHDIM